MFFTFFLPDMQRNTLTCRKERENNNNNKKERIYRSPSVACSSFFSRFLCVVYVSLPSFSFLSTLYFFFVSALLFSAFADGLLPFLYFKGSFFFVSHDFFFLETIPFSRLVGFRSLVEFFFFPPFQTTVIVFDFRLRLLLVTKKKKERKEEGEKPP